ncbi:MAG: efflux RND transporter periplasmic adaptor subunit [Ahniella sp.]|nr:efflux RND transporter periplasmic adaptor subunit [Ahniella sp.]
MFSRRVARVLVIVVLAVLLAFVALRSGPLAPVAVTVAPVESDALKPAVFGIGTIAARHLVSIGPVLPGRLGLIDVDVGDKVVAGQIIGNMDPVDLDDRVRSQEATIRRVQASVRESSARRELASSQLQRQERLYVARMVSEETLVARRQELAVADAALAAIREELARVRSEGAAANALRGNFDLTTPITGIVVRRNAEPGSTLIGRSVIDVVDPESLWINVRIDQATATGLAADLPAHIALRSRDGSILTGRVLRVEPTADSVTEEVLAKVVFTERPDPLPPLGELAEVTIDLPALAVAPWVPNAAIHRQGHQTGVWRIIDGDLAFVAIEPGRADLDGRVQVRKGLAVGDPIVVYSERVLTEGQRIRVVEHLPSLPR